MGRTAEGRSELVELLADDSATSADATIPSSPTRSKVNDGETKCSSMLRAERQWNMGNEMQDSRKNTNEFILAKTLTQATQKSTARPNRELRDQAERRKTTTEHGPC